MIFAILLFAIFLFNPLNCIDYNETIDRYYSQLPRNLFNVELELQNPSSFWPPKTDAGGQAAFKYPFAFAHTARTSAGWARQVNVNDFPIATKMAGVQMRLLRGGIREIHWHQSGEWGYVIYGCVRIYAVNPEGKTFIDDLVAGDLWYFPGGWPHSLQGTGHDGAFLLMVSDDANFDEFATFPLTDYLNGVPPEVLSKNFATPESTFKNVPDELFIFPGAEPEPLAVEIKEASEGTGIIEPPLSVHASHKKPNQQRTGGGMQIVDKNTFPQTSIAATVISLKPGGMREMHWHPNSNADVWQYFVTGRARETVFDGNGRSRTMDFAAGDIGYVSQAYSHYLENTCEEEVIIVALYSTPYYQGQSLALLLAHLPSHLVDQHIRTGKEFIKSINKTEAVVVPW